MNHVRDPERATPRLDHAHRLGLPAGVRQKPQPRASQRAT